jgi:hypothetical protein
MTPPEKAPLRAPIAILTDDTTFLNPLKMTVENHGCSIVNSDLKRRIINLGGPDEAVGARAIAACIYEGDRDDVYKPHATTYSDG